MADAPIPSITGKQLIRLLKADEWAEGRKTNHGISLSKVVNGERKTVTVPNKKRSMVPNTLHRLIGPLQADIGRDRLGELIEQYGL